MPADFPRALRRAIAAADAPGAAAYVGTMEATVFRGASGLRRDHYGDAAPATEDTLYDLASLTKVVATATAIMLLWEEGRLDLNQPVSELLPYPSFGAFTTRHLLTHTSGLPALHPLQDEVDNVGDAVARIAALPLRGHAGARYLYSDLGYILLGRIVHAAAGRPLDVFCADRIFRPLVMERTRFNPPPVLRAQCAPTEDCPWRGRLLEGEVHDERAYALGGVAGHAGLFAPIDDLAAFVRGLLDERILRSATLAEMTRMGHVPAYPWQGLGWKVDPWREGVEGYLPSRAAFGHTGWTGTCLWADRGAGLFAILLANTCHPNRARRNNRPLRRVFFTAVADGADALRTNTHTGLDRLLWDKFEPLEGRRVALLTHRAAIDQLGRPLLEVFKFAPATTIARIFTPEHGLEGQAEAGETVGAQRADVPVTSLYGERTRPTRGELDGIDRFVVDLQDVGARYYTYPHTLRECLRACAEARVPVLVLDRPNPLGGLVLEGPIAESADSPVCWGRVPVRHGLTLGEIALYFWKHDPACEKLRLEVYPCDNWPRERLWQSLQLPWHPPSPNIPTPETALLYAGMCLFEGLNLNEGRGTSEPFRLAGAPWLDAAAVLDAVPAAARAGCTIDAVRYTPEAIPGKAANPHYRGEVCNGLRIAVADPAVLRPFTLAIAIIAAMHDRHGAQLEWRPFFDTLAGGPALREALQAGRDPMALAAGYADAHAAWRKTCTLRYATWDETLRAEGLA